ncbi:MAG TPA: SDR family oxidoreductase [Bacteroidales bacterium]|jgi:dTDP-4-dehydrorhamnose reductase
MGKVLITGSNGMLGNVLAEEFYLKNKNTLGVDLLKSETSIPFVQLDLTELSDVESLLNEVKPAVIIHTAAYTNVDFCEKNHELTDKLHINATKLLADYSESKAKLVFISSDSVFDGMIGNYREDDNKAPTNYYAKTKDVAEEIIKSTCDDYIIVRTNIFGFHQNNGSSLVEWALNKLFIGEQINGFTDVYFNAIYTRLLSRIVIEMINLNLKGTYHVCSNNSVSKFEFLKILAGIFKLDVNLISPIKMEDSKLGASRPKNTTLNTDKIHSFIKLPSVEDGLNKLHEDYLNSKTVKMF